MPRVDAGADLARGDDLLQVRRRLDRGSGCGRGGVRARDGVRPCGSGPRPYAPILGCPEICKCKAPHLNPGETLSWSMGSDPRGLTPVVAMTTTVKICGLRTEAALEAAIAGGADYVGLVFFPPSPRDIAPEAARPLAAKARGRARIVTLMVDPDDALIDTVVAAVDPDLLQLHGEESPERVAEVRRRWAKPVMKAIKVETAQDAKAALAYKGIADLVLFDARPPKGSPLPGGNGVPFDWRALVGVKDEVAYMLSGGLTPDNVAAAIAVTGARIVDVSSGVEARPGEKDPELIRRFLLAAKAAKQGA